MSESFDNENIDAIKQWLIDSPQNDTGVHTKQDTLDRLETLKSSPTLELVKDVADALFTSIGGLVPNSPKREGAPMDAIKQLLDEAKGAGVGNVRTVDVLLRVVTPKCQGASIV